MTAKEKYHEKKLMEQAMYSTEKLNADNDKAQSVIDYNVMMCYLADPEQEEN